MRSLSKFICSVLLLVFSQTLVKAQTTLVAGDIAFTGYISNDPSLPDQFSFVLLKNITATTVIKFTDYGWRTDLNAFNSGTNLESEITFTAGGAFNAGTEITIGGTTATLVGGGSAGTLVYSTGAGFLAGNLSLPTSGDQVFAYQNTFASPNFISGIHMNVYTTGGGNPNNTDAATWDGVLTGVWLNANSSGKPAALTTGTNALWFGTSGNVNSEEDNAKFNCTGSLATVGSLTTNLYNTANWTTNDGPSAGFTLPTGCNYLGVLSAPTITGNPSSTSICAGANASFTGAATGATGLQWQVDTGSGFTNLSEAAPYSGTNTATLTITGAPASFNGYQYRLVASNGSGSANTTAATLTVTALPVGPTLLAKTPASGTVADGTNVSATFNAGSGGTGCSDDFRYTTNGGASYLPYTPGSNISTTGIAAGSGMVFIEGRRASCSAGCQGNYAVLASWVVTPLPAGATTLAAGDIAFTGYTSTTPGEDFSFVLLKNIGAGTVINFTNNGWLSTNVFRTGEQTITWTSNAAYSAGTEIKISATTATLAAGSSAGTVTGTALNLSTAGNQILAYTGSAGSPTFISAIHMNVETGTTAAAWDGAVNSINASALPTGLTTGVNAIWIGTPGVLGSEFDNSHYGNCAGPGTLGPITALRAALNNQANWISDNSTPPNFVLPTGCPYLGVSALPSVTTDPVAASVCEGQSASFTVAASGATNYQWQVNTGSGFADVTNSATYSGATTATLNIAATPLSFNTYQYRAIVSNGGGADTSAAAILTVTALPISPSILVKTPASNTVADGTNVSATFNAGSGGTGCTDDFRYTTDGGVSYLPYTPGTNISTTGLAAGSGFVVIEGRRANCSAGCQGTYKVLAAWRVTPLPVSATTLVAGDIAFSGYASTSTPDAFSFVLLKNIGPGTVINFTDNGWLSTNVFGTGEQTLTWTGPAGGLPAGTEIAIAGTTATKAGGGAAGTVTGTALSLAISGDQVLAYTGTTGSPTFISGIHMNVEAGSTAAAWDGAVVSQAASALPTGLTTGVNAIWIGTAGVPASEFDNSRYGNCSGPGVLGPLTGLRAALNNQANWISNSNTPPGFTLPVGCNFLSALCPTITVTNPATATGAAGVAFSQTFTATGGATPYSFTTTSTLPTGLTLSAAGVLSGTPTQGGTFPIVVTAADANGCTGDGATYTLVISCPTQTITATPSSQTICSGGTITTIALAGGATGTVYNWTRDNNAFVTGIAASGSGDITGALTNTTSAAVTVTFTITPVIYGCSGTPVTATVLVQPAADAVATPASQSICSGAGITTIAITGSVTGTTFNWTRDNTTEVTGVAASGSGDISAASLINTTNAPVTVTFTITPTANSCPGTPVTATVTVNPIPNAVATPASQDRCTGTVITPIVLSGNVSGTSFNWVRDNVGTIGGSIGASGNGNISGNLVNNTGAPVTVTFTITPTANGCPGTPITATVTVNPAPINTITGGDVTVCGGSTVTLSADPSNTQFAWGYSLFTSPYTPIGTGQTVDATKSGSYQLSVRNQYGCTSVNTTNVNIADFVFNGSIAAGDPTQTGRLNRFAVISTCAAPKACPGAFATTGARRYDSYTVTNYRNVPVCATFGINSTCSTNIFAVAYTNSFNPTSLCTNYLADGGSSFNTSGFFEATIPANGTVVLVVHEVNANTGCGAYSLTVDVPRDTSGITVTPNDTVCVGTPVTLTAAEANSYLWTPGGATTRSINFTATADASYSVRLGYGNVSCTTNVAQDIIVAAVPTVDAVADQAFCYNTTTTPITFSGTVPGTTYSWTNNNTAIGLGASGTGNIPAFTATNGTGAPISATITVTPSTGNCIGTPATFTIYVAPESLITSVTHDSVCSPGGVVNLGAIGNGSVLWYDSITGGALVNTGATYMPNITATTTYYVENWVPASPVQGVTMPAQSSTFPGNTRGYMFTAPTNFTITSLRVPTTASSGNQSIAVVKFNGNVPPPVFSASTNAFTTLFLTQNNTASGNIPVNIPIQAGEVIVILASRGGINSYSPTGSSFTIAGQTVGLTRAGMQFPLATVAPRDIWQEPGGNISRVEFEYALSTCVSSPRVPVTGTVLQTPDAVATPASQTVCSGPITTIVLTSAVPGTTYAWTRDNTGNVSGIAASGTGDISGTLTNNTTVAQTVTFTITPTSPDGCVGTPILATVNVQAVPTATCPANITVSNTTGQCGTIVTYTPTITGIPTPTVTYTFTGATTASGSGDGSGSFFNVGTTTVTVTAVNACGTASCSFTVTVNDTEAPIMSPCPAPAFVSCTSAVPPVNTSLVTATDNCPGPVVITHVSDVITGQTCANRYTITRTYRATDAAGNFSECTQIITVNDITPPSMTCPPSVTVSCTSQVPPVNVLGVTGVSDNCGGAITVTHISDVISGQTCTNRYTISRTYRATDVCGNFTDCVQTITVYDETAPLLTCPAPVTVSCAANVPPVNVLAVTGVSDNCSGPVTVTHISDVISNQTCANRYTILRTYRATDACGNFSECTQPIIVNDDIAPTLTCPANITVSCAGAVPAPNIALVTGVSDNCSGAVTVIHVSDIISNQTCANRFTITRTYRATDVCGNSTDCTQIITVNDVTPPTITCPAPVTVSCAGAVPAPNIASVTGVSDNCGSVTVTHVGDVISNLTCTNRYTITRTYRATDACGNFTNCTQIITVNDVTPPTLTCPAPVTVACREDVPAASITAVTNVSDNCGGPVTITHRGDVISNHTCFNQLTITRTYRATDACGNFTECTQIITVDDRQPPVITCPAPITVSCTNAVPAPNPGSIVATDNCSGPVTVIHVSDNIGGQTCANSYTITRKYRATDACGNFSECIQIITVRDQIPPVITCPGNITETTAPGSCTVVMNYAVTASDNCGGAVTVVTVPASGTAFPIGTTTVTSTATDACGNFSVCTFTVTIVDGQRPIITAQPAQQTVCAGNNATFSVTATNVVVYRWQKWNGTTWNDIPGANGPSYTVNQVTQGMNNDSFRVVLQGPCTTITSNAAALRVSPVPTVTLTASPLVAILPGLSTTITATATPPGGTFTWFFNNVQIPGVTGNTLGPIRVDGIGNYKVVYTDLLGCSATSTPDFGIFPLPSNNVFIYPNPNTGRFQIRYYNRLDEAVYVQIYDALGKKVLRQRMATGNPYSRLDVNLSNLGPGVYVVEILNASDIRQTVKRVVVTH